MARVSALLKKVFALQDPSAKNNTTKPTGGTKPAAQPSKPPVKTRN